LLRAQPGAPLPSALEPAVWDLTIDKPGEQQMDYVKPAEVAAAMVETGRRKLALPPADLLIRGMLSGAILGVATSLAFTGAFSTGQPLVGAIIFPVGLVIIVLLGLELITGSFALLPLPWLDRSVSSTTVVVNWGWVFLANLIGSVAYGALLAIALTNMGAIEPTGVAARIISIAEARPPVTRRSALPGS